MASPLVGLSVPNPRADVACYVVQAVPDSSAGVRLAEWLADLMHWGRCQAQPSAFAATARSAAALPTPLRQPGCLDFGVRVPWLLTVCVFVRGPVHGTLLMVSMRAAVHDWFSFGLTVGIPLLCALLCPQACSTPQQ